MIKNMNIIFSGTTDIGRVRKSNQDSICLCPEQNFFAVADGMGGHNGGDIASQMCTKLLSEYMNRHSIDSDPTQVLTDSIKYANSSIYDFAQKNENLKGMGTTIVSSLVHDNRVFFANIGDSRAYLIRGKKIYQITKDHSLVQEKLNMGLYDRAAAKKDPQKNVLVRTVGFEYAVEPDIYQYKFTMNDIYLLCSDGLHGKVTDQDILFIVESEFNKPDTKTQSFLDRCSSKLISQANSNGGQDNISVVLMQLIE